MTQPVLSDAAELISLLARYDCGALPPGIAARVSVLIAVAHRLKTGALDIEAQAKRHLADEYDATQERGEVAKVGQPSIVPNGTINVLLPPTSA